MSTSPSLTPVETETKVEVPVTTPAATPVKGFRDKTPSNWEIRGIRDEEGNPTNDITAFNTRSFEKFEGTVEDFNINLRG